MHNPEQAVVRTAEMAIEEILKAAERSLHRSDAGFFANSDLLGRKKAKYDALTQGMNLVTNTSAGAKSPREVMENIEDFFNELKDKKSVSSGIINHRTKDAFDNCIQIAVKAIEKLDGMSDVSEEQSRNVKRAM